MSTDKFDHSFVVSDLKTKRAALDALISAYEMAQSLGALGVAGEITGVSPGGSEPVDLPVGAFRGKSVPAAVKLYLSAMKRKQTNLEITTALKDGGVESTGKLEQVIASALNRLKASGEVLRFKDGWDLAEHHNAAFRARLAQGQKPEKPKKKKTAKVKTQKAATKGGPRAVKSNAKSVTESQISPNAGEIQEIAKAS